MHLRNLPFVLVAAIWALPLASLFLIVGLFGCATTAEVPPTDIQEVKNFYWRKGITYVHIYKDNNTVSLERFTVQADPFYCSNLAKGYGGAPKVSSHLDWPPSLNKLSEAQLLEEKGDLLKDIKYEFRIIPLLLYDQFFEGVHSSVIQNGIYDVGLIVTHRMRAGFLEVTDNTSRKKRAILKCWPPKGLYEDIPKELYEAGTSFEFLGKGTPEKACYLFTEKLESFMNKYAEPKPLLYGDILRKLRFLFDEVSFDKEAGRSILLAALALWTGPTEFEEHDYEMLYETLFEEENDPENVKAKIDRFFKAIDSLPVESQAQARSAGINLPRSGLPDRSKK
jgi:hypothetical protein